MRVLAKLALELVGQVDDGARERVTVKQSRVVVVSARNLDELSQPWRRIGDGAALLWRHH